VGTAGALRYRLPAGDTPGPGAMTNVYGYLTGAAAADGSVTFAFHQLSVAELRGANQGRYPDPLVNWCYDENKP
jgi:hypothetical protein